MSKYKSTTEQVSERRRWRCQRKTGKNYRSIDGSMKSKRVMRSYDQPDSPFKSMLVDLMAIQ